MSALVVLPPVAPVTQRIAEELNVAESRVIAAVDLLDGGATVPFVARYRKEATGSLDDAQLRDLEERLGYLRELDERRTAIAESIAAQGKLTASLAAELAAAGTKARLEDIYLPFKTKRRTKAQIAREAGLEPLALTLLRDPSRDPQLEAGRYLNEEKAIPDAATALAGARSILVERFAEDANLVGELRELLWRRGRLGSELRSGKDPQDATNGKFRDYFLFAEPFTRLPSHRVLAMLRGEKEEILSLTVKPEAADPDPLDTSPSDYEKRISARFGIADRGRPADPWLRDTVRWAWRTKLLVSLGIDVRTQLRQAAERAAADVFAANLRDLLLAAPAGGRPTMGLDPGFRTGVKVAVVDGTGQVVATDTIYPHQPHNKWDQSLATLHRLASAHHVELVSIGNGTASRETDKLATELTATVKGLVKIVVSEAGASVYSASAYASQELPGMDVSLRGAVSIARRLQDPLAELVKIDPKSIGVGQYQHDVAESLMSRTVDNVVEDCVNAVGVDVNTASVPLLARVSGITTGLAGSIVEYRNNNGPFGSRKELGKVPRLGPKAFEQCAGFLRIPDGSDPLDRSGVHPEAYPVVRKILQRSKSDIQTLVGNTALLRTLQPEEFVDERFGVPTIADILAELEKPGRDPRPAFTTATFAEGVEKISDLRPGMILEGVVTNVAAFGAFVDVGVHQDGLVHVSAMAEKFVSDPRTVVRSGQVVRVKVMEVDPDRKRIALSLRLTDEPGVKTSAPRSPASAGRGPGRPPGDGREGAAAGGRPTQPGARPTQPGARPTEGGGQSAQGGSRIPDGTPRESGPTGGRNQPGQSDRTQPDRGRRTQTGPKIDPPPAGGSLADALRKAGFGR